MLTSFWFLRLSLFTLLLSSSFILLLTFSFILLLTSSFSLLFLHSFEFLIALCLSTNVLNNSTAISSNCEESLIYLYFLLSSSIKELIASITITSSFSIDSYCFFIISSALFTIIESFSIGLYPIFILSSTSFISASFISNVTLSLLFAIITLLLLGIISFIASSPSLYLQSMQFDITSAKP